jgi:Zn-dependent M16 (insulinase) family peptidase
MNRGLLLVIALLFGCSHRAAARAPDGAFQLLDLREDQLIEGFRVSNIYIDSSDEIVGAKFVHADSGAPIYVLRMETVPQVFMWVDTPATSNQGLPHALEHLLAGKGTTGRYSTLLKTMRLSQSAAATALDFNFYSFSSGSGIGGFMEQFHAWLRAL